MKNPLFLVLLLLVACTVYKPGPYSFEDGWAFLKQLDTKYSTDIKKERMNMDYLDMKQINPFQQDLNLFAGRLQQDPDSLNKKKLLNLVESRRQMLDSERFYQLALNMGNFSDEKERSCDHRKEMEFAYKYYDTAVKRGDNATRILDGVLQDYEPAQTLIGLNENRLNFYSSYWDTTLKLLDKMAVVLNNCTMAQ